VKKETIPFEVQIFVCTNDQKGDKPSCGDHQGEAVFKELRRIAKEKGLHPRIRVSQAKCLGKCNEGVNIMTYPEKEWYSHVTLDDIDQLQDRFFGQNPS